MISTYTSIIVPCYNEEAVINEAYKRIKKVLVTNKFSKYEMIFINDGSTDKTLQMLEKFAKKDKNIKIISFSRNFGHQPAVTAGIHNSKGEVAIIIDADLQDPPELFPEMIKIYKKEKCNVVYGVRKKRGGESWFKKITAKLFYRTVNSLSEVTLPLDTGDFRLIDKNVINAFKSFSEKNKYIRGIISWIGFKQCPIYFHREPRLAGETKYPLKKMIKFAVTGLLYFTKKPLKLAFNLGLFSFFIGIGLTLYVFIARYTDKIETVPGWASTLITIIFFSAVQLLTIGFLGGYIGRIFDEVKDRPEYIIDKKINIK